MSVAGSAPARIAAIQQRIAEVATRSAPGQFGAILAQVSRPATSQTSSPSSSSSPAAYQTASTGFGSLAAYGLGGGTSEVLGILGTPVKVGAGVSVVSPTGWFNPPPSSIGANWASALPERGRQWAGAIEQAAAEAGLDPRLLAAVVWAESAFKEDAVSGAGALGLAQLMPKTAEGLGVNPNDPMDNLRGGAKYLERIYSEFGRVDLTAAAYNAGPGRVRENGGLPYVNDAGGYVQQVVRHYRDLGGQLT